MCMPFGLMRSMNAPYPIQIMQTDKHVAFLFEQNTWFHVVPFRNAHVPDANPTWFGDSIAKWDGDTLIVDTVDFNGYTRLDTRGNPHSDKLHLTQTFRRTEAGHIAYSVTIDDPVYYSKPWTNERTWMLSNGELIEYSCEENNRSLWEGRIKIWVAARDGTAERSGRSDRLRWPMPRSLGCSEGPEASRSSWTEAPTASAVRRAVALRAGGRHYRSAGTRGRTRSTERFTMRVVATGLAAPWEVTYGPDQQLWVTEREGKRVVRINPADGSKTVAAHGARCPPEHHSGRAPRAWRSIPICCEGPAATSSTCRSPMTMRRDRRWCRGSPSGGTDTIRPPERSSTRPTCSKDCRRTATTSAAG